MSGVELGLAIIGTIDLCLKYGSRLNSLCASLKSAESEVAERVVHIEALWMRICAHVEFMRRVWTKLNPEHQAIQNGILQVLNSKLTIAVSKIERVLVAPQAITSSEKGTPQHCPPVKRFKYALLKESLDRAIEDLEKWQKTFDPSWYLMLMVSDPQIDTELNKNRAVSESSMLNSTQMLRDALRGSSPTKESIFLPADGLRSAHVSIIHMSSTKLAQRAGSTKLFILDSVHCWERDKLQQVTANVRELARKLSRADPLRFGLLECRGVLRSVDSQKLQATSFTFVFRTVPGHSPPQSLRASLVATNAHHSLSDRLEIARDLAKSVSFVHTFGFVHKSICPENILISSDDTTKLGHCFLVGFQEFRAAEGHSLRAGDDIWARNLYRHPARQGRTPDEYYIMQHDIYSLGCCLLEVGMWESLISYSADGTLNPAVMLQPLTGASSIWDSVTAKEYLVHLARSELPRRMGSKYARVVETCLTCLDEHNADFGDESEFQDADGVLVGVRYIEKVLLQLDNISM